MKQKIFEMSYPKNGSLHKAKTVAFNVLVAKRNISKLMNVPMSKIRLQSQMNIDPCMAFDMTKVEQPLTRQDYDQLQELIGTQAYKALAKGEATLRIWRNTTPHNWWVESKTGKMLWHSDSNSFTRPKLNLFTEVDTESYSRERVNKYGGVDAGRPASSTFILK